MQKRTDKKRANPAQSGQERIDAVREFLRKKVRPLIPPEVRGKPVTKREREEILGIGPGGYPE